MKSLGQIAFEAGKSHMVSLGSSYHETWEDLEDDRRAAWEAAAAAAIAENDFRRAFLAETNDKFVNLARKKLARHIDMS